MDDLRFDNLTRRLAATATRRGALKLLAGGVAAGLAARLGRAGTAAAAPGDACGTQGIRACTEAARAAHREALQVCENLVNSCAENCKPYECAGCFAYGATCRVEATQALTAATQACAANPPGCGPCEVCQNGTCAPKRCANSCTQCDPSTGACEPIECGPCEICVNGACRSECTGCSTCFQGECVASCPSCQECRGDTCVPLECPACHVCFGNECILAGGAEHPDSCAPGQTYNPETCQCEGCAEGQFNIATDLCCPDGPACGDDCCEEGEACCNEQCVATQSDRLNCGGCGVSCNPTQVCTAGQCGCGPGGTACGAGCCAANERCDPATSTCVACPEGQPGCGSQCCPDAGYICDGNACVCPSHRRCDDQCCPAGQLCCDGACVAEEEGCCSDGSLPCHGECCPEGLVCGESGCKCADGGLACPDGWGGYACCGDGEQCCNNACIPAEEECCEGVTCLDQCCEPEQVCGDEGCCTACGVHCCSAGTVCCNGECSPEGELCCPPGETACGTQCCTSQEHCSFHDHTLPTAVCCPQGYLRACGDKCCEGEDRCCSDLLSIGVCCHFSQACNLEAEGGPVCCAPGETVYQGQCLDSCEVCTIVHGGECCENEYGNTDCCFG